MAPDQALRQEIIAIYNRRARHYDLTANLYYLIGYPEWRYRRITVESLALGPGDTVVEIGCGTGMNFNLVEERIGPEGKLIGVDLTEAMLDQAKERVDRAGWSNVELLRRDAAEYTPPEDTDALFSTFAISLIPEAPQIITRAAGAMSEGGRLAIMDLKIPSGWPERIVNALMIIVRPFTPTEEWRARRPWPAIEEAMDMALNDVSLRHFYFGTTYLISGETGA